MNVIYMFFAIMAGIFSSAESIINARLGKYVTASIATPHSLATGMAFILLISLGVGRNHGIDPHIGRTSHKRLPD